MDSRRLHPAIGMNNDSVQPDSEELDLALTLGLPVKSIYVPPQQGNPDFINGPYSRLLSQGLRPSGTMNGGGSINPIGMNNPGRINGGGDFNPIGMNNAGTMNGRANINPIGMNNAGIINGGGNTNPIGMNNIARRINGGGNINPVGMNYAARRINGEANINPIGMNYAGTMNGRGNINPIGMNNAGTMNGRGNINHIGMNNAGRINGGGNINPIGMNNAGRINGIEGYPFMTQLYNSNAHQEMNGYSHAPAAGCMINNSNGLVGGQFIMGSSSSPSPSSAVGIAVNNLNNEIPAPTMKEYTLLNTSNRRSTSSRKKSNNNSVNNPNKQCSNYNCRTSSTPMWRKGPLGLNTLCNSCGIKYRKEWKRKKDEQEMMKKLQQERDAQNNN